MGRRLSHPQLMQDEERCLTFNAKNSTGAGASSCSKPAASPVRPTAPCSPPGAKPRCSRPSSPPRRPKPGQDFFPLTVHYQEKAFAAGRIPGGYLKREGRPSDRETLTSRLIDRPIRPLFPDDFRCDTQVIATVFSYDLETDSDILAMIASSAALTLSGVPFMGPIGAARVGVIKGEIKVNPTVEEMKDSDPRSRRRRHRGRRADGRVGGPGALRRDDAEGGDGRPRRVPAGDPGDHPPRRKGRQGAARSAARTIARRSRRRCWRSARPICAPPIRSPRSRSATPPSTPSRRR